MELKDYQQRVLDDLAGYLQALNRTGSVADAYTDSWQERGVRVGPPDGLKHYQQTIPGVPHVCAKVPTAGGKTFIAVNALETIFTALRAVVPERPLFVVWLVPSLTILDQTVKGLADPANAYRKRLDQLFRHRVAVYEKKDLLMGAGFSADTVKEQLSIVVMSYDSLRAKNKEDRKIFQENGNLASFAAGIAGQEPELLAEHDSTALINVIRALMPVVVVDESHNAESDLSVEMLKNLNPYFILDLTATPRKNSNIISYVDAMALKKQHMVKLPVIVANRTDRAEVIESALILRRQLEEAAIAQEKQGGKYIRPIVLFQAQAKTDADNTTFDKIKDKLVELRIPANQIAIKTAGTNELKGVDLMSRDCPIRYIITVNALKEGWDCPFAYVLASLADKSSAVDVEQILGRILRMPHVSANPQDLLNMSYVLTASNKFMDTLQNVVVALNRAGFTDRDYRAIEIAMAPARPVAQLLPGIEPWLLNPPAEDGSAPDVEMNKDDDVLDVSAVAADWDKPAAIAGPGKPLLSGGALFVAELTKKAKDEGQAFEQKAKEPDAGLPKELEDSMNRQKIKDVFTTSAAEVKLPQFVIKVQDGGWFTDEQTLQLFEKDHLLVDFKLSMQDASIEFDDVDSELYRVDLEEIGKDNYRPVPIKMAEKQRKYFAERVLAGTRTSQVRAVTDRLVELIGNLYPIADGEVRAYVRRIVDSMTPEQIKDCLERDYAYKSKIKTKIDAMKEIHQEKAFGDYLDVERILVEPRFALPTSITPNKVSSALPKSLYSAEGDMGEFERGVINDIANLDSVRWWHRNLSRGNGFCINGFMNHYPDFIVRMKSGRVVVIETKGDDRDNSDSERKLKLGKLWESKAGSGFRYYMVFANKPVVGAEKLTEALVKLKQL